VKRPSIWPLLVIVMVIGNVFALLVFQDRLQTSELQVSNTEETIRQQSNLIQSVERELLETGQQVDVLQQELVQSIELEGEQAQEIEALNQKIEDSTPADSQADIAALREEFNNQLTINWIFSISAIIVAVLEIIFR
jgi:septal ring factor EnvC (AmiA/AmiB activator)